MKLSNLCLNGMEKRSPSSPLNGGRSSGPTTAKKSAILINFMDAEEELCHNLRFTT